MLPNIGCFADASSYEFLWYPDRRRSLLGGWEACGGSLDLSVVLGRRTFNRIVEGARRGPSYGPSPSMRARAPEGARLASPERPRRHAPPSIQPAIVRRAARATARLARAGQPGPALPVSLLDLLARWIVYAVGNQGVWCPLAQMRAFPTPYGPRFCLKMKGGSLRCKKKAKKNNADHLTGQQNTRCGDRTHDQCLLFLL